MKMKIQLMIVLCCLAALEVKAVFYVFLLELLILSYFSCRSANFVLKIQQKLIAEVLHW